MAWKEKLSKLTSVESQGSDLGGSTLDWIQLTIETPETLASVVKEANEIKARIMPFRLAEKEELLASWARKQDGSEKIIFLNLKNMSRIVEHVVEDQVISCQTGLSIEDLNNHLDKTGQWLPAFGKSPGSSLLNLLEDGNGGPLDTGFGGPRNLILGTSTVSGNAVEMKSGGKIVKNVTGYDLTKLLVGARSWLGITHTVHLRLFAKPQAIKTFITEADSLKTLSRVLENITRSGLPVIALEALDSGLAHQIGELHHERYQAIWQNIASSASGNSCCIIASIAGQKNEVENTSKVLERIVATQKAEVIELDTAESMTLFESLSQIEYLTGKKCFSMSLPCPLGYDLFGRLKTDWDKLTWIARPSIGLFDILFDKDCLDDILKLKERVTEELKESRFAPYLDSNLTVSYPQKDQDHTVERYNDRVSEIITGVKNKFDNNRILNPLVRF